MPTPTITVEEVYPLTKIMFSLLLLLPVIVATSYALTRAMVACSESLQLIDVPNARSSHIKPTPRGGGAAVVISSLLAIQLAAFLGLLDWPLASGVSLAGGLIAVIGFWDDRSSLSPAVRFIGQMLAAGVLMIFLGAPERSFDGRQIVPGILVIGIVVIGVTWLINLTNFMDGIDGLAAAECVFVLLARAALPFSFHETGVPAACLIVAAAGLGFLLLNWAPAKIFMGDVGSNYLGVVCGALMLADTAHQPARVWVWMILLAAFLADSGVTLLRRLLRGQKVWQAHRSHAYQHAAKQWGHAATTAVFALINIAWLAPLALFAERHPQFGFAAFVVAILPLCAVALSLHAGLDAARSPKGTASLSRLFESLLRAVIERRTVHLSVKYAVQFLLVVAAGVLAFFLRFDFSIPFSLGAGMGAVVLAWAAVHTVCMHVVGGMGAWRYFSLHDMLRLAGANIVATLIVASVTAAVHPGYLPVSVLLLQLVMTVALSCGLRTMVRVTFETFAKSRSLERQRTLVYGAGRAGVLLLQEARKNGQFPYVICGFVDDQKHKGWLIQGTRVLGNGSDLRRLVQEHRIAQVLIAIPSARGEEMQRITEACHSVGVAFRTMPAISEMLSDRSVAKQIRDVRVEDVLGRNPVHLDTEQIRAKLTGKVVVVTGAAGSIGSELCRQVARFAPAVLVAFDISETAMFFLEREMQAKFPDLEFRSEIGSIQNLQRLREVFAEHRPQAVFHAAAFKHVPLMEKHMFEAVENNVFGTYNVGKAAAEAEVDDFVMISTDKAVRPTNVMGATKRTAELIIRSLQKNRTRFVSVRFGNVLGSNGSVLPIFKQQIATGGPLTVTHPDIERFFMTIPEAAQLVLQACSMGSGGEIFVLDMGKPVKIVDLAKKFIQLSGFEPERDIQIAFTGLRPGEKMYEELNLEDENTLPTQHEKIKVFAGKSLEAVALGRHLERLREACRERKGELLLEELKCLIPDYRESTEIRERAFTDGLLKLSKTLQFESSECAAAAER